MYNSRTQTPEFCQVCIYYQSLDLKFFWHTTLLNGYA